MDVERVIDVLVAYLATYAVHGALLGALALFVARKAADRAPVAVERLLRAALLGGLVTAAMPFVFGFEPLCGRFVLLSRSALAAPSASQPAPDAFVAGSRAKENFIAEPSNFDLVPQRVAAARDRDGTLDGVEHADDSGVLVGSLGQCDSADGFGGAPQSSSFGEPEESRVAAHDEPRGSAEFASPAVSVAAGTHRIDEAASPALSSSGHLAPGHSSSGHPAIQLLPLAAPASLDAAAPAAEGAYLFGADRLVVPLLAVWLVGVAVGVVRAARDLRALRRALRWRTELRGGRVRAMLDELCDRAGTSRRVRLSIAPCTHVPLSFGLFRPEIGLPPRTLEDLGEDEQRAVLAHELAHLARRDILWLWLARALGIVFWFQPLQRFVARELERRAEFAADLWARGRIGSGAPLASALAEIAGWLVEERRSLPAAPMARERSQLVRRVELLLEHEARREPRSWSSVAPLACAVVAAWSPAFGEDGVLDGSNVVAEAPSDADLSSADFGLVAEDVVADDAHDAFDDTDAGAAGAQPAAEFARSRSAAEPKLLAEFVRADSPHADSPDAHSLNAESMNTDSMHAEPSGLEPVEELDALLDRARSPREVFEVAALALDLEVEALETELADLERELAAGDPDAEIEAELAQLRERVDRLLERRGRMRELFLALTDELGAEDSAHLDAPDAAFAAPEQDTARHAFFPEESR
ncbi:MAG: hypothetical protein L6Q99_18915 [Planctomycetes bacterium]|nr:hypothetical protein [Planctomycetota bacterium]